MQHFVVLVSTQFEIMQKEEQEEKKEWKKNKKPNSKTCQ